MTNYNSNDYRSDDAVLSELGSRLSALRLTRNMTQAQLAHEAGVSKRTLERMEAGQSAQITNYIRVLRALNILELFEQLFPQQQPGPMDLLKQAGKLPKRASGNKTEATKPWKWGDDK
ncbi:MAG: helix-turn-helix transcriptional regulator [Bacteroidetes bacterium]|nr:helix-turn-helix transcriptional regulator [Bacteroidota bacterium]